MSESNLQKKKIEVMKAVGHIDKDGENKFQKYNYVSEANVLAVIRKALIEHGITISPSIDSEPIIARYESGKGKMVTEVMVEMTLTAHDVESGETEIFKTWGQGQDHGDKSIPKAITMASKYGILKYFQLSTKEDAEADTNIDKDPPRRPAPQKASAKQVKTLDDLGKKVYKADWAAKRQELVEAVSKGAASEPELLSPAHVTRLITGLKKKEKDSSGNPALKKLHALGKKTYGELWDEQRKDLVALVSNGKKESSTELTPKELSAAIKELEGLDEIDDSEIPT